MKTNFYPHIYYNIYTEFVVRTTQMVLAEERLKKFEVSRMVDFLNKKIAKIQLQTFDCPYKNPETRVRYFNM